MSMRDGQPSPEQARKMARVFVIATLLGGVFVFLNVTLRSYNIRMQQAELKSKQQAGETAPGSQTGAVMPDAASASPEASRSETPTEGTTETSSPVTQPQREGARSAEGP